MLKRRFVVFTIALVAILSIATGAMAQDKTVVRIWTGSSSPVEDAFFNARIAAFSAANPDVIVAPLISPDYDTSIQNAFASGDYPEVFRVDQGNFQKYRDSGVLAEGTGKIDNVEGIYPKLLDVFSYDGVAYCPPKDFSTLALFYNKDMFDAAGVAYPSDTWTWQDMYDAAKALTNDTTVGLTASDDYNRWLAFFYANGGSLFDADKNVVFNSAEGVAALDFWASFVRDGIGKTPKALEAGWNGEAFGQGKAAMSVEGNWALGYTSETFPEINYGVAELPMAPSGNRATLTFSVCWAVAANATGATADAAWKLVNFLTGEDGAAAVADAAFGVMPARSSAGDAWIAKKGGEIAQPFVNGAAYAIAPVFPLGFSDFVDVIAKGTALVFDGTETSQQLMDEAAQVASDIAAEMK